MKYVWPLPRRAGLLFSMVFSDLLMVCVGGVGVEPTGRYRACYPKFPAVVWERGFEKPMRCRRTVPVVPFHPKSHAPIALSAWEVFVLASCLGWREQVCHGLPSRMSPIGSMWSPVSISGVSLLQPRSM